jgi:hypothetical protein
MVPVDWCLITGKANFDKCVEAAGD